MDILANGDKLEEYEFLLPESVEIRLVIKASNMKVESSTNSVIDNQWPLDGVNL